MCFDKHDSCCFGCLSGLLGLSWFCRMGLVGSLGVVVAVRLGYVSVIGLVCCCNSAGPGWLLGLRWRCLRWLDWIGLFHCRVALRWRFSVALFCRWADWAGLSEVGSIARVVLQLDGWIGIVCIIRFGATAPSV